MALAIYILALTYKIKCAKLDYYVLAKSEWKRSVQTHL